MRARTLGPLAGLIVALVLTGCGGDQPKQGDLKAAAVMPEAGTAAKAGPSAKAMRAQVFTAAAVDPSAKTLSDLRIGASARGRLGSGDDRLPDGKYMDFFTFQLGSSAEVDLSITSPDFDTYLVLMRGVPGGNVEPVDEDDDGGDGTNSRITTALGSGSYTLVVTSYRGGETGSYTLSTAGGSDDGAASRLEPGATVSGTLTGSSPTLDDGSHYRLWPFHGRAGDRVTITMRSDDFDTYLMLITGTSVADGEVLASDDDGAGSLNSRIVHTLPETGTYSVVANAYGADDLGRYELELQGAPTNYDELYPGGGDPNDKYALLVGIDDYPGTDADLRGPIDDIEVMRDVLVERFGFPEENIVMLRDAEASRLGIANAIIRHLTQAGPNGTAVFFYSGHGSRLDENVGLTGAYDPEEGNGVDEALSIHDSFILDEELGFLLRQIEAEKTWVIVDACYSGTSTRGPDFMPKAIPTDRLGILRKPGNFISMDLTSDVGFGHDRQQFEEVLTGEDRHLFFSASSEDEVGWGINSWEPYYDGPMSLFSFYLTRVLAEAPLSTTFQEVHEAVRDRVGEHTDNWQGMTHQTPQIGGPTSKQTMTIGELLGG